MTGMEEFLIALTGGGLVLLGFLLGSLGEGGDGRGAVEHDGKHYAPVVYDEGYPTEAESVHIARHGPSRVLREVAAKRALVDQIFEYEAKIDGEWGCCHEPGDIAAGRCRDALTNGILSRCVPLLSIYSDRPGFDPRWCE